MSDLKALRDKALTANRRRLVEYPICLDAGMRAAIAQARELMDAVAIEASAEPGEDAKRRTVGDMVSRAVRAVQQAEQQVAGLLEEAEARGVLVYVCFEASNEDLADVVRLGLEAAAEVGDGPAGDAAFSRAVLERTYTKTIAPDGADLEISWPDLIANTLTPGDIVSAGNVVAEAFNGAQTIPFARRSSQQQA